MSKSRKFLILAVIVVPLATAAAVSAWVEGDLRTAIVSSISTIAYGFGFITLAWGYRKPLKAGDTSQIMKRLVVWERPFWWFMLTIVVVWVGIGALLGVPMPLSRFLRFVCYLAVPVGILWCGGLFRR